MKKAVITGINGQDGILLSQLLLENGYMVFGFGRQVTPHNYLDKRIRYGSLEIQNTESFIKFLEEIQPDEIYNLAGFSSVSSSFSNTSEVFLTNAEAVDNILQVMSNSETLARTKFFQSSSSEMFGIAIVEPQTETTAFNPISPYAKSKVIAHQICQDFRSRGMFVSCGILYNHESIYRSSQFVTRKISQSVARIHKGYETELRIGNIYAERDWGFAGDYVRSMFLMLQQSEPDDFVISSGTSHSVKDLISWALQEIGRESEFENLVVIDQSLIRPVEISRLVGDSSKARTNLNWAPNRGIESVIREMVKFDISNI